MDEVRKELRRMDIRRLRSVISRAFRYSWDGPSDLLPAANIEWRLVLIRWVAGLFVAAGLPFLLLSGNQLMAAYGLLGFAAAYNSAIQVTLQRRPQLLVKGYFTTICDGLLNIAMIVILGGFHPPFYYILFPVTISAAMRFGYPPAVALVGVIVGSDMLEHIVRGEEFSGAFFFRSGFLLLTAILAGYLREQARKAEEALRLRLREANSLNKELEAFSYSVSHDLRAPLRSIYGFSEALLEDYYDKLDEEGKDYLSRITGASRRMAGLIDDILNLSRVTRADIETGPVDLSQIAREITKELKEKEPGRNVDVIIPNHVVVQGDGTLLRAMMDNLLGNAWKFTGKCENSRIEFGNITRDGQVVYFVQDNGAGFNMEYSDKLFGAFQRLHSNGEFEGTGIGLATVQRIVNRHGGQIWAKGEPGKGAVFYFTLGNPGKE